VLRLAEAGTGAAEARDHVPSRKGETIVNRTHVKLFAAALAAPLLTACAAQDSRLVGPPIPSPLSVREAAQLAQSQVGPGGRLSHIDCLDDGQLFGVDSPTSSAGGAVRESRILFVHNDGVIVEWPGR
jgi:hypothetical protein